MIVNVQFYYCFEGYFYNKDIEANTVDRETLEKEVVTTATAVHNFLPVHIAVKSTFA